MTPRGKVALDLVDFAEDQNSISQEKHNPPYQTLHNSHIPREKKALMLFFDPCCSLTDMAQTIQVKKTFAYFLRQCK